MAALKSDGVCAVICAGRIEDYMWLKAETSECAYVLCADAGYLHAKKAGIKPDVVIGDFDSTERPDGVEVITYPVRKDDTDASLAISYGVSLGYSEFSLFGATAGSRLDHTVANLIMCASFIKHSVKIRLIDEKNEAYMALPGTHIIKRRGGKLSVFAFGGTVKGLTERGVSYPLTDFTLTADNSLGISNEITEEQAVISFSGGVLLIMCSRD